MSKSKTAKKKGTLVYVGDRKYNYQLPIVNWGWDRELELQLGIAPNVTPDVKKITNICYVNVKVCVACSLNRFPISLLTLWPFPQFLQQQ